MNNIDQPQEFNQFKVVHQLKRRVRVIAPSLFRDKERAYILQILLLKREAIDSVKIVSEINSVTIHFDPELFPKQNLLNLLETVLVNFSQKPHESIQKIAEHSRQKGGAKQKIVFGIGGMSCASCALFLEMVLTREPDNIQVSINYISETGTVKGYLSKEEIFKIVEENGYQAYSIDTLGERKLLLEHEQQHLHVAKKRLLMIGLLGVPVVVAGMLLRKNRYLRLVQAVLSFPAVFLGGRDVFKKSVFQLRQGSINMDTLVAIGAGSAFTLSIPSVFDERKHAYFDAATAIIGFVQLGRYLEELAKSKMVAEIKALVNMQPQHATLLKGDGEISVAVEQIKIGDVLLVRPGERVPVDGVVIDGLSSVDESTITGSNTVCVKEKGHEVFDGSMNGSGVLKVRAVAIGKDTKLAGLVHMIDQSQSSKLHIQKTVDVISSHLMPSIAFLSGVTFIAWFAKGERVMHALSNAISVLLISCPCALGLATPAATSVSSGQAAKRKIYIRNGHALETMTSIDTIIFDKTGTLTEGNAEVSNFQNISSFDDDYVMQVAASAEFNSEHLLGKAIVSYAKNKGLSILSSSGFHSTPDQGVRSHVDGHDVLLGSEYWLNQQGIDSSMLKEIAEKWTMQGGILVYFVIDSKVSALFALKDNIRVGARGVVEYFHLQNINVMMITGDTKVSAKAVAECLGIQSVTAQASPAKKIQIIRELQKEDRVVAMVGDGVNDAPALAAADVSLVMSNAVGVAIETADFVLVNGDISKVAEMQNISKQTVMVVKQNLFWAFVYNVAAIPIAMTGKLNPMVSSAAMALSSLSVVANSLRLRNK